MVVDETRPRGFAEEKFLLEPIANFLWRVDYPICYHSGDGQSIYIPRDFVTDFASIPRVLWSIMPPWRFDYGPASLVHDMGYFMHRELGDTTFSRSFIDDVFYDIMLDRHTPKATAWTMYQAVRFAGDRKGAWNA